MVFFCILMAEQVLNAVDARPGRGELAGKAVPEIVDTDAPKPRLSGADSKVALDPVRVEHLSRFGRKHPLSVAGTQLVVCENLVDQGSRGHHSASAILGQCPYTVMETAPGCCSGRTQRGRSGRCRR